MASKTSMILGDGEGNEPDDRYPGVLMLARRQHPTFGKGVELTPGDPGPTLAECQISMPIWVQSRCRFSDAGAPSHCRRPRVELPAVQ